MPSIGGQALRSKLEKLLWELSCKKNDCLCLGKNVDNINYQMKVAYNYWVITNQCELTDDEINCIVNDLRETCNFKIPREIFTPIVQAPEAPIPTTEGVVYTSAVAYNMMESLNWVIDAGGAADEAPRDFDYKIVSIQLNGIEYVIPGQEPLFTMSYTGGYNGDGMPNGLNWIPATNQEYGWTYTNQVDDINGALSSLGITGIKAQIMTKDEGVTSFSLTYTASPFTTRRYDAGGLFILKTDDVSTYSITIEESGGGSTITMGNDIHSQSWMSAPSLYSSKDYEVLGSIPYPRNNHGDYPWKNIQDNAVRTGVDYSWWSKTDPLGDPWNIVDNVVVE